jgi:hypothetical protein
MTLGFDASTSCAGWAFYDGKVIVDAGFIKIDKFETSKAKAFHVIELLEANPLIEKVKRINLEAALSGFAGGFTSQQVIITLARFNAVFEYVISEQWATPVNLVNVSTARKIVLGKARLKGVKSKDYVRAELPKLHPEVIAFEKLNRKGEWDAHNSDMYDAAVIAMA